jgi:hypothetical protein
MVPNKHVAFKIPLEQLPRLLVEVGRLVYGFPPLFSLLKISGCHGVLSFSSYKVLKQTPTVYVPLPLIKGANNESQRMLRYLNDNPSLIHHF